MIKFIIVNYDSLNYQIFKSIITVLSKNSARMDNEIFYDSLEESFSSTSSTSVVIVIKPNFSAYANHIPQEIDDDVRINLEEIVNSAEENSTASGTSYFENEFESEIASISQYEICSENTNDSLTKFRARWDKVTEPDVPSIGRWNKVNDISSIVPLYGGDKNRSEIELTMKSSSTPALNRQKLKIGNKPSTMLNNINSNCGSNKYKQRSKFTKSNYNTSDSCISIDSLPKANPNKSYLKIFHSRIGYPTENNRKLIDDTARSIFGDSTRSNIEEESTEEFADAEAGYGSDTTSFYLQYIENCENKMQNSTEHLQNTPESFESSMPPSNIESVSELFLHNTHNVKASQKKTRIPKRPNYTPVPFLGNLGPDPHSIQEKLERRKKQLNYGQKASNRNRIKMVESKVLKNLNKEILKSNYVTNELQKL